MNIDGLTIQCFLALASSKSFTKAAKQIGRTQSAVSQQITKLEDQLRKKLVNRDKISTLTVEGEIFLGYAKQIFALQREAIDRIREPDLVGKVRFGLPEDFASVFLSSVLADFARTHPRIQLSVECDLTLNLYNRFKKEEFDLVLVKMSQPEDFPYGIEVWKEKLEWVGQADAMKYLLGDHKIIPLALSPQPCVYRSRAIKTLEQHKIKWRQVYSSPSYAGTIAAVKAGLGITVLPHNMIPHDLTAIKCNSLPKLRDTHISLLKHKKNNAAINSLEEFVLKNL